MKKYLCGLFTVLLVAIQALPSAAVDVFRRYEKVIFINQPKLFGSAYERGQKLFSFPIITGDDETPTPPGAYVVKVKDRHYYSRHYKTPMPYSLFFDFRGKRAIHEGPVPPPSEANDPATHGCIHVEQPYMKWLFDWAEVGKTVVIIYGRRDWGDVEGEDE